MVAPLIITNEQEALEAIANIKQNIQDSVNLIKEIAKKFNLDVTINIDLNNQSEDDWQSSDYW